MNRDKVIRLRVTEEEKKELESRATALGLNLSEYMRLLLISHPRQAKNVTVVT